MKNKTINSPCGHLWRVVTPESIELMPKSFMSNRIRKGDLVVGLEDFDGWRGYQVYKYVKEYGNGVCIENDSVCFIAKGIGDSVGIKLNPKHFECLKYGVLLRRKPDIREYDFYLLKGTSQKSKYISKLEFDASVMLSLAKEKLSTAETIKNSVGGSRGVVY